MPRAWNVHHLCVAAALAVLAGCGGGEPASNEPSVAAPASRRTAAAAPTAADGGYAIATIDREAVRLFYKTVYGSSSGIGAGWSGGSIAGCQPGTTSADHRAAVQRRINWFRAMAGVPAAIGFDAGFTAKAQQAALLMAANNQLSHSPPSSWTCHSATGAEAAGKSNLALGTAADAVIDGYMRDAGGNNAAVGHRRWVLHPPTRSMGVGTVTATTTANALWVIDGHGFDPRPAVRDDFVAWPPRGYVPYTAVYPRWSFSYPQADFSQATVTVVSNGNPLAVQRATPENGYGENTLVWQVPTGDGENWPRPAADTSYQVQLQNVRIGGQARSFSYSVTVFDPDADTGGALAIAGSSALVAGQSGVYALQPWSGAQAYQWRSIATAPYDLYDGGDTAFTNLQPTTSAGYDAIATDVAGTGGRTFHLTHTQPVDQVLQLRATLVGRTGASLSFASRLGFATPSQVATVEASTDDGATWSVLHAQAGGTVESGFATRTVPLAALVDRSFVLRWRYAANGSYYPQAASNVGWLIDDIRLTNTDTVASASAARDATGTGFTFGATVAEGSGDRLLQARALLYGHASGWGPMKRVTLASAATADCLFDWAQSNYPALFPGSAATQLSAPYSYRYYAGTQIYLGISAADGNVYYLANGLLNNAGSAAGWFATAGCR